MKEKGLLQTQYGTTEKLERRISLHEKYSVNKTGFANWIAAQFAFPPGTRVLELGCGTGSLWRGREELISRCGELVLTDLSPAMVEAARAALGAEAPVRFLTADIRELPFPDGSFDAVIANMMLYHVPELDRALSEVRRVLRPAGRLYAATYGEHGVLEELCRILAPLGLRDESSRRFTLQNGAGILGSYFSEVRRLDYPDSLRVTDPEDLLDYLDTLPSRAGRGPLPREEGLRLLRESMRDGVLTLPKEYGIFVAGDPAREESSHGV